MCVYIYTHIPFLGDLRGGLQFSLLRRHAMRGCSKIGHTVNRPKDESNKACILEHMPEMTQSTQFRAYASIHSMLYFMKALGAPT